MLKKKLVKQGSGVYTITIPKNIVEINEWENAEFKLEIVKNKIILTKSEE